MAVFWQGGGVKGGVRGWGKEGGGGQASRDPGEALGRGKLLGETRLGGIRLEGTRMASNRPGTEQQLQQQQRWQQQLQLQQQPNPRGGGEGGVGRYSGPDVKT